MACITPLHRAVEIVPVVEKAQPVGRFFQNVKVGEGLARLHQPDQGKHPIQYACIGVGGNQYHRLALEGEAAYQKPFVTT